MAAGWMLAPDWGLSVVFALVCVPAVIAGFGMLATGRSERLRRACVPLQVGH
jgi:hypothetical protein